MVILQTTVDADQRESLYFLVFIIFDVHLCDMVFYYELCLTYMLSALNC